MQLPRIYAYKDVWMAFETVLAGQMEAILGHSCRQTQTRNVVNENEQKVNELNGEMWKTTKKKWENVGTRSALKKIPKYEKLPWSYAYKDP